MKLLAMYFRVYPSRPAWRLAGAMGTWLRQQGPNVDEAWLVTYSEWLTVDEDRFDAALLLCLG